MRISKYSDIEEVEKFLEKHPNANIFQTPEMCQVYSSTKNYEPVFLSVVTNDNEILGVLLALIQKEHSGLLGKFSARSIIWGGPLIKDNNPEVLDFILEEHNKTIKKKAIYTQFRNLWSWSDHEKQIFEKNGFHYEAHLDILIDLRKSEDELLNEIHKGRRKNIRRAARIPLEFEEIVSKTEFDQCIQLIKQTYKRVKLPCPDSSYFYDAADSLKKMNGLKAFALKYQHKIISTRFVLCYNKLIYDWYAGTDELFLVKYPNDYLPWKVIQWAKENGYNTFDFGGAGKPNIPYGVRDYKLKFGGELVEFGRFENVHKPILMHIGKTGLKIYKLIKHVR